MADSGIEPIAVVGMGLRVPGADTPDRFWANLRDGVESITFFTDHELRAAGVPEAHLADPDYVKASGALADIEGFDAEFFGFTPREAETLDPQHRVLLECCWRVLEHAGCDPQRYDGRIGVYGGVGLNGYLIHNLLGHQELLETLGGWQLSLGNDKDFAPSRVAYKLNLQGPAIAVNTACSTSLVATVLGCQSLLNYQCDLVLAGGCSIHLPQDQGYWFHKGGTLSPDGHCRPFDAAAAGTIDGSGAAIVALKRLEDARADGDTIHGLIRGFAVNNDGDLKVGYTAPSVDGQAEVVREALQMADVVADDIGYVETHGTGTDLGDPVEIAALVDAFRETTTNTGYCAIGSVKSNVGHLDTAAGTASLIKALIAMGHGQIPPTLHFRLPNPKIDFASSPFYVNGTLADWHRRADMPRRAGVSSFGIGGTNAHVVVEEAPADEPAAPAREWQLIPLSARRADDLDDMAVALADHLETHPDQALADVAHTLQVGRGEFRHRRVVVGHDPGEAIKLLREPPPGCVHDGEAAASAPVVFLFPGQDVQHLNMAAGLRAAEPVFRKALAECASILASHGIDLDALVWPAGDGRPRFDPDFGIDPVPLLAVEYAMARLWQSRGVEPAAMLGYSLGEYVMATLAQVLSLEDALALAAAGRQRLDIAEPGSMLAVALGADELAAELDPEVHLAMTNGPRQCVVGGRPAAVTALQERLRAGGVTCQPVPIARAYHTPLMAAFAASFREALEGIDLRPPTIPYISCVTGDWITDAEATDPEHFVALSVSPVRLADALDTLFADELCQEPGIALLEVAPAQALSSLAAQSTRRPASVEILSTLRDPRSLTQKRPELADEPAFLTTLGRLWTRGVPIDWTAVDGTQRRLRVPLPGHPFRPLRHWVDPVRHAPGATVTVAPTAKLEDMDRWFHVPGWRRTPRRPGAGPPAEGSSWLVFADTVGWADEIASTLRARGDRVTLVRHGDAGADEGDITLDTTCPVQLDRLVGELSSAHGTPHHVVHLATLGLEAPEPELLERGFYSVLHLGRALGHHCLAEEVDITLVADGSAAVGEATALSAAKAAALGPIRVIPQEYPNLHCRAIDVTGGEGGRARTLTELMAELDTPGGAPVVALRAGGRWVEGFDPMPLAEPAALPRRLRHGGTYLITGGLGNIGLTLAEYLHRAAGASLVLMGRTGIDDASEDPLVIGRRQRLQALRDAGARVHVAAADVADAAQVERVFLEAEARFGAVHGVIHAAGLVGEDSFVTVRDGDRDANERQFRPKVCGLAVLDRVLAERDLDFCLLCSSLSPILGGLGFSAYAATNLYLDAAAERHNATSATPWISVNWEGWRFDADETPAQGAGAAVAELGLLPDEGVAAFARIMDVPGLDRVVVSTGDLQHRLEQWVTTAGPGEDGAMPRASGGRPELLGDAVTPRTPTEERLVTLWQQLLGIDDIGAFDSFFELGGNSLMLTQLVALMRRTFQVDLSLQELFNTPTVADIAAQIDAQRTDFDGDERDVGEI